MISFVAENLAAIMGLATIALLLAGYPFAFTVAGCGVLFFGFAVGLGLLVPTSQISLHWDLLRAYPERMLAVVHTVPWIVVVSYSLVFGAAVAHWAAGRRRASIGLVLLIAALDLVVVNLWAGSLAGYELLLFSLSILAVGSILVFGPHRFKQFQTVLQLSVAGLAAIATMRAGFSVFGLTLYGSGFQMSGQWFTEPVLGIPLIFWASYLFGAWMFIAAGALLARRFAPEFRRLGAAS